MFRQVNQSAYEYLVFAAIGQASHKRAVDLDNINAQHFQVPERGKSGPEIVNRDLATHFTQIRDESGTLLEIVQCSGLRQLNDESPRHALVSPNVIHERFQPA